MRKSGSKGGFSDDKKSYQSKNKENKRRSNDVKPFKKTVGSEDKKREEPIKKTPSKKSGKSGYSDNKKPYQSKFRTDKGRSNDIKSFKKEEGSKELKSADPLKKAPAKKGFKQDEILRLNRFLSNSGVCSRREADKYISSGCVTVNGKVVSELGTKVSLYDDVKFNGATLNPQDKIYLLLNKPKGFVTTTDDPQERKTVMDLVDKACKERIYPVGRLDKETTGVLLFTNDGELSKKLTHPSYQKKKIYHVYLDIPLTKNHLLEISKGVTLEDGAIAADAISYVKEDDKKEVGIEIHSGKNRIVRRIFSHFGYEVQKLDRVYFAGLTKKNLPRGKWRFLTQAEINQLKMH